jgi:acyl carrier protein phosphodiesterase
MNWLAHIFLSEDNIDFQIGNYLADPLKAKAWENANKNIQNGMTIHKLIDSYTDKHPTFKQSKNRLGNSGLLKAVVIDLTYDYLLTKNWHRYSTITLDKFLDNFYANANNNMHTLPNEAKQKLEKLIEFDLLNKYQTLEHLNQSFQRVDKRISLRVLKRDNVSRYYEIVCKNIDEIENDFLLFFPQLCNKVKENVNSQELGHWKI